MLQPRRTASLGITSGELLLLAVILGIAGSLTLFVLGGKRAEGRDAERVDDVQRIATAMELYFNRHVRYPQSSDMPQSIPEFLNSVPMDLHEEYGWVDNTATGENTSQDYCLSARLERMSPSGGHMYVVAGPLGVREREASSSYLFTLEDCE